jgi:molybdopterin converting factor small subunit
MSKVRLEFRGWFIETLDSEAESDCVILEQDIVGDRTVGYILDKLARTYPRFGQLAFDRRAQKLTGSVAAFFNGSHLELANGLRTKLGNGDVLTFVTPIEGG